jgi:hypothetical protein
MQSDTVANREARCRPQMAHNSFFLKIQVMYLLNE